VISYAQVALLSYGLEASRPQHYNQLLAEKQKVEASLREMHRLQGLLPICASCKNVRDDEGYWHQVETYMKQHAGMEFSHSICPDCRVRLYPTLGQTRHKVEAPSLLQDG
jgi:hypothetical protein